MRDLGIEFISVFGLPPVDFVHLAADLGCRYISTALTGRPLKSLNYPAFSLKDDIRLRREMLTAMDERGVGISLGEGMLIAPDADVSGLAADLDVIAELKAAQINTLGFDRDRNGTFDQSATLTEMATGRGMGTTIELAPGMTIGDPDTLLAAIEDVGRPDLRLALDTMHWVRADFAAAELCELGPEKIGYVQLCDTTVKPRLTSYINRGRSGARYRRRYQLSEGVMPSFSVTHVTAAT